MESEEENSDNTPAGLPARQAYKGKRGRLL